MWLLDQISNFQRISANFIKSILNDSVCSKKCRIKSIKYPKLQIYGINNRNDQNVCQTKAIISPNIEHIKEIISNGLRVDGTTTHLKFISHEQYTSIPIYNMWDKHTLFLQL